MSARRRRYREKKPVDTRSLIVAAAAGASILYFFICIEITMRKGGGLNKIFAAIGMVFFVMSFAELYIGFTERNNDDCNSWSRKLGWIVPLISLALWLSLYIIGLV